LTIQIFVPPAQKVWESTLTKRLAGKMTDEELLDAWRKAAKNAEAEFKKAAREVEKYFEKEDSFALPMWKELLKESLAKAQEAHYIIGMLRGGQSPKALTQHNVTDKLAEIAREVAKVDGFDVTLRSLLVDQAIELKAAKHWVMPVRAWERNDEWTSEDGKLIGSHDADDLVRPDYVKAMIQDGLYDEKGNLKEDLLAPDCIEARDWNLSASQYKPFDFTQLKSDKSVVQLIGALKDIEQQVVSGLDVLLAMVEGHE